MTLFLGSTIGNFGRREAAAFLGALSDGLTPGSFFLLGLDLVKDAALLEAAYDDAAGVTAAFTRNLFVRMNRELGAGLDVDAVTHEATWLPDRQRIEIHARFRTRQTIRVAPLGETFVIEAGERVRTEVSRKYRAQDVPDWLAPFGFATREILQDDRGWFAVALLQRAARPGGRTGAGERC